MIVTALHEIRSYMLRTVHVEEFKKELTREVMLMTQEVGRLQRERQSMEQKIADLFAFYSKQKQNGDHLQVPAKRGVSQDSASHRVTSPAPSRHRDRDGRPLPSMRRRQSSSTCVITCLLPVAHSQQDHCARNRRNSGWPLG